MNQNFVSIGNRVGGLGRHSSKLYDEIISLKNLFIAWQEFKKGKLKKRDVAIFSANLEENIFGLHQELSSLSYRHGPYQAFVVCDPKRRNINKANVRDRVLHRAIYRVLYPIFNETFIYDSYSSRNNKGLHKAILQLEKFGYTESKNNTKNIYFLRCDIKKFFDRIDHKILIQLLSGKISDVKTLYLLKEIISSFSVLAGKGIPLGNITSQLFSNIYLSNFDHWIKRKLRLLHYIRYADDFVIVNDSKESLKNYISILQKYLLDKLSLTLNQKKISIRKWHQGIDFLGYVSFPRYKVLRTKTRRRILKKVARGFLNFKNGILDKKLFQQTIHSYRGILKHCCGRKIKTRIKLLSGWPESIR